ncbi:glycoside hydrolase family 5 protein [Schizophyllum commune H4-8]|uniref:glucan 1,3-beta-glucosidase n=1 Tax=Schizophyllum commune (strain H4-8 / FGSC 9210) TaxID=578458 RepID=D8PTZ2_SCHCM|nr:glycoside hydrolase family 5 protein [Schizophyllum commune H4-8]KAI5900779.1 glycoside hydrolase family 5 protein [Schizophyllum commune H4-8]
MVVMEDGTKFRYNNTFGGFWVYDPEDPFNDNAQPNSYTPPLNETWDFGKDKIYGVNLGGLFVIEPFITPSFFQQYPDAKDEWDLSLAMSNDTANGGLDQLEKHYDTFITEQDIAEIAGAGLNWLRIPIAFWAIETWEGEPFLAKTSWTYLLRVLKWARKYGLRVCLDLHAVPGSQNGYNHSGRLSPVNLLNGNMGLANAQRTLYYIRVLTEFISQPEYRNLIPIFGIVNEALVGEIGMDAITSFYLEAHNMIREITGYGEGNGPYIAIHDGFQPITVWENFLAGSDRIILDQHPYFSFGAVDESPIDVNGEDGLPGGKWPKQACDAWAAGTDTSQRNFGVTISGEMAASPNDCGLFLRGAGSNSTNSQCPYYDDWQNYNDTMKEGIQNFALASFDALQNWFFWTWKIGPSAESGEVETPLWSYQLGYRNGWLPSDPRSYVGKCAALGSAQQPFDGTYSAWQTGGETSTIVASSTSRYTWPPASISGADVDVSLLPTYTATGSVVTLPPATFTDAPSSVTSSVDGWYDDQDTAAGITTVSGCPYPDEYNGIFSTTPTAPCTGPTAGRL